MASFDETIPPGGVGKITLSMSTKGYLGSISKKAQVYSNDSSNRNTYLTIMAVVKEKEGTEPLPSPELPSPEPMLPGPPPEEKPLKPVVNSNVSPPPGEEVLRPIVDPNVTSPPGVEPIEPVVDPNVTPPPGVEPIAPVVDPNVAPPPRVEPLQTTPSLKLEAENISPSDTEEENIPE